MGSWLRGGNERKARGRTWSGSERGNETRRTSEAIPVDLVDGSKKYCTGKRLAETCLSPRHHAGASNDGSLAIWSLCPKRLLDGNIDRL